MNDLIGRVSRSALAALLVVVSSLPAVASGSPIGVAAGLPVPNRAGADEDYESWKEQQGRAWYEELKGLGFSDEDAQHGVETAFLCMGNQGITDREAALARCRDRPWMWAKLNESERQLRSEGYSDGAAAKGKDRLFRCLEDALSGGELSRGDALAACSDTGWVEAASWDLADRVEREGYDDDCPHDDDECQSYPAGQSMRGCLWEQLERRVSRRDALEACLLVVLAGLTPPKERQASPVGEGASAPPALNERDSAWVEATVIGFRPELPEDLDAQAVDRALAHLRSCLARALVAGTSKVDARSVCAGEVIASLPGITTSTTTIAQGPSPGASDPPPPGGPTGETASSGPGTSSKPSSPGGSGGPSAGNTGSGPGQTSGPSSSGGPAGPVSTGSQPSSTKAQDPVQSQTAAKPQADVDIDLNGTFNLRGGAEKGSFREVTTFGLRDCFAPGGLAASGKLTFKGSFSPSEPNVRVGFTNRVAITMDAGGGGTAEVQCRLNDQDFRAQLQYRYSFRMDDWTAHIPNGVLTGASGFARLSENQTTLSNCTLAGKSAACPQIATALSGLETQLFLDGTVDQSGRRAKGTVRVTAGYVTGAAAPWQGDWHAG